jgi:hypothetical protein
VIDNVCGEYDGLHALLLQVSADTTTNFNALLAYNPRLPTRTISVSRRAYRGSAGSSVERPDGMLLRRFSNNRARQPNAFIKKWQQRSICSPTAHLFYRNTHRIRRVLQLMSQPVTHSHRRSTKRVK